jgi:multicomponent Na+:H+ antiporter subunit D
VVRLWFDVMPGVPGAAAMQLLAALGAAAIVLGSVVALRQERLKLLIAYSTLAQIGYLFLMFPLAFDSGSARLVAGGALAGGILQAMSHATAKAAMFMAAGLIYAAVGHDRISGFAGVARALPLSVLAFVVGGVALIGLPPSGAYLAKELMLGAAGESGQWWWTVVIQAGGVFTSGYLWLVLVRALAPAAARPTVIASVPRLCEAAALTLALCSLLLGLVPWEAYLSVSSGSISLTLDTLLSAAGTILGGGVLAVLLARWGSEPLGLVVGKMLVVAAPVRRITIAFAAVVERLDRALRQWPAATLSLLALAILFGAAILAGR